MFENLVLQVLTRLLGDYVEDGLDVNNLKVGIWSGKIELEKLKLRRDALDAFDLPLVVAHGFIGSVHVTVPWSNLKQEPVIVAITDVHIVVRPRSVVARDRDDARRRAADRKRARLALHDDAMLAAAAAVMSGGGGATSAPAADETFVSKLMTKILDNVQVQLDRVHLRFEDDVSDPLHPFACGLTLQRVTAQSCNETWLPAFVTASDASEPVRKRFELNSCAFYWSCDSAHQFLHRRSPADIGALLAASIVLGDDAVDLRSSVPLQYPPVAPHDALRTDFILQPARATLRVLVNKSTGSAEMPNNTLDFRVDSIDVALLDRQYRDVASLLDWMQRAPRRERYSLFRPLAIDASGRTPTPREQPRLWWQFAIAAVCFDVRERARKTRWNLSTKFLVDRGRKRRRYVQLYSLKLANQLETASAAAPSPPPATATTASKSAATTSTGAASTPSTAAVSVRNLAELREIEDELQYDDIVFCRSLARALAEPVLKKMQRENLQTQQRASAAQGWIDWAWSWAGAAPAVAPTVAAPSAKHQAELNASATVGGVRGLYIEPPPVSPHRVDQVLDDEARRAFFAAIEYDPHAELRATSQHTVEFKVRVIIREGSLTVRRSEAQPLAAPTVPPNQRDLVCAVFNKLVVALDQRPSSLKLSASLASLEMHDRYTLNTCFPRLIVPLATRRSRVGAELQIAREIALDFSRLTGFDDGGEDNDNDTAADADDALPFFECMIDTNSPRTGAGLHIVVRMQPSELVYNPYCTDALLAVVSCASADAFAPISDAAREKFDKTAGRVLGEMERSNALYVDVQFAAPTIVLPQAFQTSTTTLLVVDLGMLSVVTHPIAPSDALLGSFSTCLSRLRLYLVDRDNRRPANLSGSVVSQRIGRRRPLVDRFDVLFDIERRAPQQSDAAQDTPQLLVSIALPSARVEIGPREYDELLGVLDRALVANVSAAPPPDAAASTDAAAPLHELVRDSSAAVRTQLSHTGLVTTASPLLVEVRVSVGVFECELARDRAPRQASGAAIVGDDGLLRLTLRNLIGGMKLRPGETTAFVALEHIAVLDCVQSVLYARPCYVLTPAPVATEQPDCDALRMSAILLERDALAAAEALGAAMALDVAMAETTINFDRETLVQLINVLLAIEATHERWSSVRVMRDKAAQRRQVVAPLVRASSPPAQLLARASSPVAPEATGAVAPSQSQALDDDDSARWRACDVLRVRATLRAVDVRLNCGAECFATLSLASADLHVRIGHGRAPSRAPVVRSVRGAVGAVTLIDMRGSSRDAERSCGHVVVDIDGAYTVDFVYEHVHVPRAERICADGRVVSPESIRVRMSAIQLVLRLGFFFDITEYFAELGRMNETLRRTVTAAADAAIDVATELITDSQRPVGYLQYAISVAAPRAVVVGRVATLHTSASSLTAQLGHLTVSNHYEVVGERLLSESVRLRVTAMNVRTSHGQGANVLQHPLIDDIDIALKVVLSPLPNEPIYRVQCAVTAVECRVNDAQFELARAILESYELAMRTPPSVAAGTVPAPSVAPPPPVAAPTPRRRARESTLSEAMSAQFVGDGATARAFLRAHGSVARVSVSLLTGGIAAAPAAVPAVPTREPEPLASFAVDRFQATYAMPERGLVQQQAMLTIESFTVRDDRAAAPHEQYRNLLYCGVARRATQLGGDESNSGALDDDEASERPSPLLFMWTSHSDRSLPDIVRVRIERPCVLLMNGALLALTAYAHKQLAVLNGVSHNRVTPSILRAAKPASVAPQQPALASALRLECIVIQQEVGLLEDSRSIDSRSIVVRATVLVSLGVGVAATAGDTTPMSLRVRMRDFEVFKSSVSQPTDRVSIVRSVDATLEYASLIVAAPQSPASPVGWATDDDDLFSPDMREARSSEPHAQLALRLGAVRIAFSYTDFQLSLRIASRYATTIASVMGVLGSPDVPLEATASAAPATAPVAESVAANWRWHNLVQQHHREPANEATRHGLALLVSDDAAVATAASGGATTASPMRQGRSRAVFDAMARGVAGLAGVALATTPTSVPTATPVPTAPPKPALPLFVSAACHAVRITLIHDAAGRNVPLIDAAVAAVRADVKSAAKRLDVTVESLAKVDYYNPRLSVWEPLVEQWAARMVLEQTENTRVTISSPDVLNVNITAACADAMLDFVNDLSREQTASPSSRASISGGDAAADAAAAAASASSSSPPSSSPPPRLLSSTPSIVATSATTEAGEVDAYFNQLAVRFTGDRQVQAMRTADELALLITETVRQLPATAFRSQLFAEIEPRTLALWRSLRRAHASERNPLARIASQQPSAAVSGGSVVFRPYVLRNHTGYEVMFAEESSSSATAAVFEASGGGGQVLMSPRRATRDSASGGSDAQRLNRTLSDGSSTTLFSEEDDVVRARAGGEEQSALATHRISFAMEGFEPQLAFPVDRVGVFVLPLRASNERRLSQQQVVCEVQFLNGSKVITLRSNVVLRNETEFALELFVAGPQQTPMSTRAVRQVLLECGDSYCVPMSIVARSRIAVRCYTTSSQGAVVEQVDARFVALSDGVSLPWLPLDAHRLPTRTVILPSDGELFFACVCNPPRLGVLETPSPSAIQLALAPQSLDAPLPHRRGDEADHVVVLRPPLVVVNVLACDAQFMLERVERASPTLPSVARRCVLDRTLKCSESVHVYAVDTSRHLVELKLRLAGYRWSTATTIDPLISSTSPATNAAPAGDDGSGATTELDRMDGSSTTTPVVSAVTSSASGQQDSQWDSMPVLRLTESNRPPLALRVDAQRLYDVRSPTDWSVTPLNVAVFAPYWLVNRTSSALRYANEQDVRSLSPSEALERSWPSDPANRVNRASMRRASTSQAVSSSTTTTSSSSTSASTDAEDALELAGHNRATTVMFSYEVGSGASTAATSGEDGESSVTSLFSSNRTCVRVDESRWSRPISFESPGTIGALEIPNGANARVPSLVYELGYTVDVAGGAFYRTKVIQFTPRFMVHNSTRFVVLVRQRSLNETALTLLPGERRALHWPDVSAPLEAEMCLRDATEWSRSVALDRAGDVATFAKLLIGIGIDEHGLPASLGRAPGVALPTNMYLIGLRIRFDVATFDVEVHDHAQRWPPYRLENCTQLALHVYQDGVLDSYVVPLKPYESRAYTWDEQVASHCVRIRVVDAPYGEQFKSAVIKLDKLGTHDDVVLEGGGTEQTPPATLRMQVYCDGATRVLRITDIVRHAPDMTREESFQRFKERLQLAEAKRLADAATAPAATSIVAPGGAAGRVAPSVVDVRQLKALRSRGAVASSDDNNDDDDDNDDDIREDEDDGDGLAPRSLAEMQSGATVARVPSEFQSKELGTFEVTLTLDAIGFSLVDHVPQELLFLSFKQLRLAYTESLFDQTLECTVRDMQCDNQMQAAPFPVLFAPNAAARATAEGDVLHLSVVRSKQHTKIFYIKYLSALLRECDLSVDELFLLAISRLFARYSSALQSPAVANATVVVDGGNGSGASPAADGEADDEGFATSDMQVVYIKLLHLNPIKLFVSFQTAGGAWRAAAVSTPSAVALALGGSGGSGPSVLSSLLTAVAVGANVDRAPLQLNSLFMKNVFSTQSDLVSRIAKHYSFQVISQLYMIIGSFDIIGNPVSLVSTLGTGVYDFFYEPANALVRSPRDFGAGLVKGTSSLVKHAVYGLFDTASKITGSVGMGAAYLSGDHRYVRERGRRVAQRANNVGEGFYLGMRELGTGFVNGMRGVFVQPIADARKDGAAGLIRGVLRGVVGAAIKPTVGLIDFGTRITQGVKNQVLGDGDRVTERVRRARHFGVDGRLEMYSAHHAYGRWLLLSVIEQRPKKQRAAAAAEAYVHHVDMEHGVLLLSNRRLLKVERRRVRVLWEVQLQQIESVETARTQRSSALVVAHSPTAGSAAGDTNALRALFDHHFGLSEDVEHDRVLRSQPRFGGALAAAAAAAPSVVAPAPNNDTLDDDGGALHHRHQEVATATTTVNAAAVPSDAEFDFVLVVRARVQWEGGAAEQSVVAGDAAVAEKRIVFGEEVEQMNVLAKLIVETIQVNRLRVW